MADWILNCSIGMEVLFAIITFLVAFYSFKIYKISSQREPKLLGLGFLSISISYVVWFLINISALEKLSDSQNLLDLMNVIKLFNIAACTHMIFFIVGLAVLSYVTLKSENPRILALLLPIALIPIIIGVNKAAIFYLISIIFMLYLAFHYILEYKEKGNSHLLIMLASFILLPIGTIILMFSTQDYTNYIIGHVISFGAYLLILLNLILALKHGKKKK